MPLRLLVIVAFWIGLAVSSHAQDETLPDEPIVFGVRPGVRFLTPTSAEIRWETTIAGPAAVAFGPTRRLGRVIASPSSGTSHRVVVDDLIPGQTYWYRFGLNQGGKRSFSSFYQLEGGMNYTPPVVETSEVPAGAEEAIKRLVQPGGYAVVWGDVPPSWCEAIAAGTSMTVVAAVDDSDVLNRLRKRWYADRTYGIRLTAQLKQDVPHAIANVVVVRGNQVNDVAGLLSPMGQIIKLGSGDEVAESKNDEYAWQTINPDVHFGRRAAPELAAWGHQYGSSGNASYSGEMLGGVDDTADLEVRWIGRPGADFGIDRNPRMPAPLAVGGRLFHQGMNRMIALDAFNGAVLWSLEIPDLRRVNIPRDCGNWCADDSHVYAAVKDRLWVIDAASGEMIRTMLLPEEYEGNSEWGYVAVTEHRVVGTVMKPGSGYSGFWDKAAWYDGKDDAATAKVCGNAIVGYDKQYGSIDWQRDADAIVHSTITISGNHVYFVEVDDPSLKQASSGKLLNRQIWSAASIVCLDLDSGEERWKAKVPAQDHETLISFGIADDDQFILQTSGKNEFHFVALDAASGKPRWQQSVQWPEDHHSAHIQHAVLMNGQIFVQPHILSADDGRVVKSGTLGKRRGCATPIGAGNSIIYRGGTGPLSLWSLQDEKPSEFTRLRPSCWLSTIPAQGMLFSPEGGGGCSCGGWMETSIGFAPVLPLGEER
ncbi:PQQ-binding-like beta-propeller repeat protein [Stieleria sp. ICT_E10.1]|uniref:outer membrane protein assembly factor BamB family protein n=1 Tax=Stieleria sedimenti TaxID=2976331 RepID=UPI00218026CE|nr:PQQ-binding-like beta-propeller repeat protein [Stieleria sedimenti]MCS7466998.1 PQQ-binding-like beta-propeller repeat protein [Stieleria sedimenti]